MMRIIGGSARGISLSAPAGLSTRPTLGRVRESVFNVLANVGLIDTRVLDVFAGTGAMGLEALSRGAAKAVFIDRATARFIWENAKKCRVSEKISVLSMEAGAALSSLRGQAFDYIFMDPPYQKGYVDAILRNITAAGLCADGCLLVVEHIAGEPPDIALLGHEFSSWKEKRVGETCVTYVLYTKGE